MSNPKSDIKVCVVTGVGPGTGKAIVERFVAGGYRVAMLARNVERLTSIEKDLKGAYAFPCDVTDTDVLAETIAAIRVKLGIPTVVIHNAVGGAFGSFREIEPAILATGNTAAYVAIDAVIDVPWTRKRLSEAPDDFFCKPADIAGECYHLAHQPRSAWSNEVVLRPFGENW